MLIEDPEEPARYSYKYQKFGEASLPFLNTLANSFLEQKNEISKLVFSAIKPKHNS